MSPSNTPAQVLADMFAGRLRPVLCGEILAEYREVLPRPQLRIRADRVAEMLTLVAKTVEWVATPPYTGALPLPDVDDWPFIAAARVADCPLITGNLRQFPAWLGMRVMTAREWVEGEVGG